MSNRYKGGVISATSPDTTTSKGVWTLMQQLQAAGGSVWPAKPDAPTIGTATATGVSGAISVTFTAPAYAGYPATITGYTVTSSPGGFTGTGSASPITVSGLTNGTSYTFTVTATNATGTGPASAASNSATPIIAYMDYLIVAGGGGGSGGGGGGGGMLTGSTIFSGFYTVTVGAGGSSGQQTAGNAGAGNNSVITGFTAIGGGYGAGGTTPGGNGGSGGGASYGSTSTAGVMAGGTATSGQGNNGGTSTNVGTYRGWIGSGGGGAGAVGGSATDYDTGASPPYGPLGGAGAVASINGATYSAGGQAYYSSTVSADATANSGNGGGGSRTSNAASQGWNGGSGIVVIRYPDSYPAATATTGSPSISVAGGYRTYTWTSSGSVTF